jgi:Flp pilus assembly protein TadD
MQPREPAVLYGAAYSALGSRSFHAAVQYATRFLRLQPKSYDGYHVRFLAYGNLLMPKQQVKDASMEVRLQPRNPDAYEDLGIAYVNNQKYAQARTVFTKAIKLHPGTFEYYSNRAAAEVYGKQPELAVKDLKKARSLAPNAATKQNLDRDIKAVEKQIQH